MNCGAEFDDSLHACPECGALIEDDVTFDDAAVLAGALGLSEQAAEVKNAFDKLGEAIGSFDSAASEMEARANLYIEERMGTPEQAVADVVDEAVEEVAEKAVNEAAEEVDEDVDEVDADADVDDAAVAYQPEETGEALDQIAVDAEAVADAMTSLDSESLSGMDSIGVISSSGVLGLQRHCPHCGAIIYAGMRRCTRCGRPIQTPTATATAPVPGEVPNLRSRTLLRRALGAIAVVLAVLGFGWYVATVVPQYFETLLEAKPTLREKESIDGEIDAMLRGNDEEQEGEESEGDTQETSLSPSTFATRWKGTYEGASSVRESGTILRAVEFTFDRVDEDGTLGGVCNIGIADTGVGATNASYYVSGSINWETGELELRGTEWIDSGDLARMLLYQGTVSLEAGTIEGSACELDGERIGPWSMSIQE